MKSANGPRRRRALVTLAAVVSIGAGVTALVARRTPPVTYEEARSVLDRRCIECHSARPTSRAFPIAPKGVRFDTAEEVQLHAERIRVRVVVERTMPLANMTSMTDDERRVLERWIQNGAAIH